MSQGSSPSNRPKSKSAADRQHSNKKRANPQGMAQPKPKQAHNSNRKKTSNGALSKKMNHTPNKGTIKKDESGGAIPHHMQQTPVSTPLHAPIPSASSHNSLPTPPPQTNQIPQQIHPPHIFYPPAGANSPAGPGAFFPPTIPPAGPAVPPTPATDVVPHVASPGFDCDGVEHPPVPGSPPHGSVRSNVVLPPSAQNGSPQLEKKDASQRRQRKSSFSSHRLKSPGNTATNRSSGQSTAQNSHHSKVSSSPTTSRQNLSNQPRLTASSDHDSPSPNTTTYVPNGAQQFFQHGNHHPQQLYPFHHSGAFPASGTFAPQMFPHPPPGYPNPNATHFHGIPFPPFYFQHLHQQRVEQIQSNLTREILRFYESNTKSRETQMRNCDKVIERLRRCVLKISPKASIRTYGSYRTRLMIPGSDIDIYVALESSATKEQQDSASLAKYVASQPSFEKMTSFLRGLCDLVRTDLEAADIQLIERTAVPVLKYEDTKFHQKVDVSVNSANAVRAVDIIRSFSEQFAEFKYLVIIVKYFLKQRKLNDVYTGGLSSYAICLLVISYFQMAQRRLNPSLSPGATNSSLSPGSSVAQQLPSADSAQRKKHTSSLSLGYHLIEFFSLYGNNFSFETMGIDVRNGGRYVDLHELPDSLGPRSSSTSPADASESTYPKPIKLYLVDPNDPSNIVTKSTYRMVQIKDAFAEAYQQLMTSFADDSPLRRIIGDDILWCREENSPLLENAVSETPKATPGTSSSKENSTSSSVQNGSPVLHSSGQESSKERRSTHSASSTNGSPPLSYSAAAQDAQKMEKKNSAASSKNDASKVQAAQLKKLQRQHDQIREENSKLLTENAQLKKNSSGKKEARQLKMENERLKKILEQNEASYKKELARMFSERKQQNHLMEEFRKNMKEANEKYENTSKQKNQLEDRIRILQLKLSELEHKCSQYQKEQPLTLSTTISTHPSNIFSRSPSTTGHSASHLTKESDSLDETFPSENSVFSGAGREDPHVTQFFKAISTNDFDEVREYIESGLVKPNVCNWMHRAALYESLHTIDKQLQNGIHTNSAIPEYLLEKGAIPDASKDHVFCCELSIACRTNHVRLVKRLIEAGADLNFSSSTTPCPLVSAIQNPYGCKNNLKIIKELLQHPELDCSILWEDRSIWESIITRNRLDVMETLFEHQKSKKMVLDLIHTTSHEHPLNLLMLACKHQKQKMARYLLELGADVNALSAEKENPQNVFTQIWTSHDEPHDLSALLLEPRYNFIVTRDLISLVREKGALQLAKILTDRMKRQQAENGDSISIASNDALNTDTKQLDSISFSSSNTTPRESDSDSLTSDESHPPIEAVSSETLRGEARNKYRATQEHLRESQTRWAASSRGVKPQSFQQKKTQVHSDISTLGQHMDEIIHADSAHHKKSIYTQKHIQARLNESKSSQKKPEVPDTLSPQKKKKRKSDTSSQKVGKKKKKLASITNSYASAFAVRPVTETTSSANQQASPMTKDTLDLIEKIKHMKKNPAKNLQQIIEKIDAGDVEVNARNPGDENKTLLHYATEAANFVVVLKLLNAGAKVNAMTTRQETALSIALRGLYTEERRKKTYSATHFKIVELLLNNSAGFLDASKNTILHRACMIGKLELVKIVKHLARIDAQNKNGETPIHIAVCNSEIPEKVARDIVDYLCNLKPDLSLKDHQHEDAIIKAIRVVRPLVLEILLKRTEGDKCHKGVALGDRRCPGQAKRIPILFYILEEIGLKQKKYEKCMDMLKHFFDTKHINSKYTYMDRCLLQYAVEEFKTPEIAEFLLKEHKKIHIPRGLKETAEKKQFLQLLRDIEEVETKRKDAKKAKKKGAQEAKNGVMHREGVYEETVNHKQPVGKYATDERPSKLVSSTLV